MAKATKPISEIVRNPILAAFFKRGEEGSPDYAIPATPKPILSGGMVRSLEAA